MGTFSLPKLVFLRTRLQNHSSKIKQTIWRKKRKVKMASEAFFSLPVFCLSCAQGPPLVSSSAFLSALPPSPLCPQFTHSNCLVELTGLQGTTGTLPNERNNFPEWEWNPTAIILPCHGVLKWIKSHKSLINLKRLVPLKLSSFVYAFWEIPILFSWIPLLYSFIRLKFLEKNHLGISFSQKEGNTFRIWQ